MKTHNGWIGLAVKLWLTRRVTQVILQLEAGVSMTAKCALSVIAWALKTMTAVKKWRNENVMHIASHGRTTFSAAYSWQYAVKKTMKEWLKICCILPVMCGQNNGPATAGPSATALLFYGLSPILGGYLHALCISIKSSFQAILSNIW